MAAGYGTGGASKSNVACEVLCENNSNNFKLKQVHSWETLLPYKQLNAQDLPNLN